MKPSSRSNQSGRALLKASLLFMAGLASSSCGAASDPSATDDAPRVGRQESAIMTDEPGHRIDGYAGVVRIINTVESTLCTGWMLNERVIVTAAHCLEGFEGAAVTGFRIEYMRPGVGAQVIHSESLPVEVKASPFFAGGASISDFFSNPLHPSEANAKHDLGFIRTSEPWPNTNYLDYLRVYNDDLRTLTSVYVYGVGNIFRTQAAFDPDDKLRFAHFDLDPGLFSSDLVITTAAGQTERLCAGDSGAPYIKKIDGLSLVAGSHHGTDRAESDFCPKPGGRQWGEKLTWDGSDDFSWLRSFNISCSFYTPSGTGNNYARCFPLPFINDAPDREQEHGGKLSAIAQTVAVL